MANRTFSIPEVLIPKVGVRTSSFYVLIAAWLVGGLFTGLFTVLEAKGYLDREGAPAVRQWLIEAIADILPVVYLAVSGWVSKKFIESRGRVSEAKATALGAFVAAQLAPAPVPGVLEGIKEELHDANETAGGGPAVKG